MIDVLMKHGALGKDPDHNGTTALHLACQKGMQKAVVSVCCSTNAVLCTLYV